MALLLSNETTLRLDQGTVLTLSAPDDKATLLEQASGGLHVITRKPRPFRVKTPFVNANVEGTEFLVRVAESNASIAVFEGRVVAANDAGSVALATGEGASATKDAAPRKELVVRPRDAVAWTLYFPTIFDYRLGAGASGTPAEAARQRSLDLYLNGKLADALAALDSVPEVERTAGFLTYRAGLLLLVGRLDEASPDIERALRLDPRNVDAYSLLAVIAVVDNDKDKALELANKAVDLSPTSPAALVALSYAQQANFRIEPALASIERAVALDPQNALAWARLTELQMSTGNVRRALSSAKQATGLSPDLAKTQTVLGFASLAGNDATAAKASFEKAIQLDQADPLSRLGLGLAKIREGDLESGRVEIEIAAILDPQNSLVRSYLGKAYFEEKRDRHASEQFNLATERDPKDPTPYLYSAIQKQTQNRPVEALQDFRKSIELNDNRAVYRSRLLLDQDLAGRATTLAQTYRDLGFEQLAALEALKSLSLDPGDSVAHRFLADSYLGQIRTEAARVSELLQAQLRQPLGLNSLQPQLFQDQQFIVAGTGPVPGYNDFTPSFNRNQVSAKVDVLVGGKGTFGDQIFVSGLRDRFAYSVGQYHYETKGIRANNDITRDIYSAFAQLSLTPAASIQAEIRDDSSKLGDLSPRFDPENFDPFARDDFRLKTLRLGGIYLLGPASSVVASFINGTGKEQLSVTTDPTLTINDRERVKGAEVQHVRRAASFNLLSGLSVHKNKTELEFSGATINLDTKERSVYTQLTLTALPLGARPQLGFSYDSFKRPGRDLSRVNPKLGLIWALSPDTTIRAAAFRTIKRSFIANQTIQPSQVSGFNQFFDDPNGTISKRVGIAFDQKISGSQFGGVEWSSRNLKVPGFPGDPDFRWSERMARAYFYWIAGLRTTATVDYQYELFRRPTENTGNEGFTKLATHIVPLGLKLHLAGSWSAGFKATYVNQKLRHEDLNFDLVDASDSFVVADLDVRYKFPNRFGFVSVEVKNMFDRRFRYQEIDIFSSPRYLPRRLVLGRLSLLF